MQTLKVNIPGEYYDSQIYDGKLYLWQIDGSILTLNWNKLVKGIKISENLRVPLYFALIYGENLYSNKLLQDSDIKDLLLYKFKQLSDISIEISKQDIIDSTISQQDNPFPFPHADSSIHYKTLYVGSQSGVSSSACGANKKESIYPQPEKLFDLPVASLSTSNLTLALAAGHEGLFDYSLIPNSSNSKSIEPRCISKNHSNLVRWMYASLFGSSYFNNGYFADFKSVKDKSKMKILGGATNQLSLFENTDKEIANIEYIDEQKNSKNSQRQLQNLFPSEEIFKVDANRSKYRFTWGVQDKLCLVTENSLRITRYIPKPKNNEQKFTNLDSLKIEELNNEIISADSSFFGIVLEQEDRLLVVNSLLEKKYFPGEPVNWRVFSKSRNYTNQLHIIYDNSLCIYSFNHDYFVNQQTKLVGIVANTK